jgi:hypothetical protein
LEEGETIPREDVVEYQNAIDDLEQRYQDHLAPQAVHLRYVVGSPGPQSEYLPVGGPGTSITLCSICLDRQSVQSYTL